MAGQITARITHAFTLAVTSANAVSGQRSETLANWRKGNLLFATALY
jgi:hypothetical protein